LTDDIKAVYDKPLALTYVVTLAEHQLSTDLHVTNTSATESVEFQALLHTYLAAPADQVLISPLRGLSYVDKADNANTKTEERDGVDVRRYTDAVYADAPGKYKVVWPTGGIEVKTKNFKGMRARPSGSASC
jgi:glucose-6-phosphate 1-epimerase